MKHTYENAKGQIITEILPPGRFLKVGEFVAKGDLRLWYTSRYSVVSSKDYQLIGKMINPSSYRSFYRPNKPKYRILKPNEVIQKGDQSYNPLSRGWGRCVLSIGYSVNKYTSMSICNRVRRPVKQ